MVGATPLAEFDEGQLSRGLPRIDEVRRGEVVAISLSERTNAYTHGLHRFPAKYVPQVPRWAIESLASPGTVILDPFMGSGTTLVEASMAPVTAIGIDRDQLAELISGAKVYPPTATRLADIWAVLKRAWRPARRAGLKAPMPDVQNFGHWFSDSAWAELQGCLDAIDSLSISGVERNFLLVLFSSILRRVSNADDQSQKTYVSHTYPKTPPPVRQAFELVVDQALMRANEFHAGRDSRSESEILTGGDAKEMNLDNSSIDVVVTSPPYLDSVDYMYNFMLEYFWLGPRLGIPDRATFNRERRAGIGSKSPVDDAPLPASVADLLDIEQVRTGRRRSVAGYMHDMDRHFAEAARVLREDGYYVMVVGNSQSGAHSIPVHDCLVRLAAGHGLHLEHAFGYRIRRHYMKFPRKGRGGIILIDWILVFQLGEPRCEPFERLPLLDWKLAPDAVAH